MTYSELIEYNQDLYYNLRDYLRVEIANGADLEDATELLALKGIVGEGLVSDLYDDVCDLLDYETKNDLPTEA